MTSASKMSDKAKLICVIGCGASGLVAIKSCLEEDLRVICYEKTSQTAGLWRHREVTPEGVGRVTKNTITNSSKELNGFSDFPYPKEFPNYMDAKKVCEYFDSFAKHFDLNKHIRFGYSVLKIDKNEDYDKTQRVKVVVKNEKDGSIKNEIFDGVMVCTGHHTSPKMPTFPGQELFKGKVIHSRDMPSLSELIQYEDKNAVVVGIANSGCDSAVELSNICDKTYIAIRRGSWIFNRVGPNGLPMDLSFHKRFLWKLSQMLPFWLICWFFETFYFNQAFNHKLYGVQPNNYCFSEQPVISDSLPSRILSGKVIPKRNIERFTEDGVVFIGDQMATKCDLVVMATGYHFGFPLIDKSLFDHLEDKPLDLYKQVFPRQLSHPSLAIIGAIQPNGGLYALLEIQSRWFAALMAGHCALPSPELIAADIERVKRFREQRLNDSPRNLISVNWEEYMDDIADMIGVKPDLQYYLFSDPILFIKLFFGTALPYQYRLSGRHCWSGARNAIIQSDYRVRYGLNANEANSPLPFTPNFYKLLFSLIIFLFAYIVCEVFD